MCGGARGLRRLHGVGRKPTYCPHLTPSLASPSSSAALLPRPSVSPFVVVFRSLVAAPFSCVIPSLRTAARDHLAVPRSMASYFHAFWHSCSPLSYRTAARDHLAVSRYLARYLFPPLEFPLIPFCGVLALCM
jgi:hypothetical protein